ncbi:Hypothetical protein POVR1_LOCUS355 [uncultured virus]|nr:Hypothetical protein POVR1_LOCUS355 [uncultured virus]
MYKYRAALIIFTVSRGLRPAFGFEVPLEEFCIEVDECKSALENFFKSHHLNLGITLSPITLIYNTDVDLEWFEPRSDEDYVQHLGRILGYWIPLSQSDFENMNVPRYTLDVQIHYAGKWHWITGFDSLEPIVVGWQKSDNLRKTFNILRIPRGGISISISYRPVGEEQVRMAEFYI